MDLAVQGKNESDSMLSNAVVENLVHTVNDKTVRSGAWLIFVKAVFAN